MNIRPSAAIRQNYNEIALPDTLAYGLIKYAHIYTFDYGDGKNTFEGSKNYDELIGKTLCGYKITGVFKIDDLPSILLNTSTNLNKDCKKLDIKKKFTKSLTPLIHISIVYQVTSIRI